MPRIRRSSSASSRPSARTGPSRGGRPTTSSPRAARGSSPRTPRTATRSRYGQAGFPMADLTAGHLLATGVLAALVAARGGGEGGIVEVSLLGAALAVQIQDLVWLDGEAAGPAAAATRGDLEARADEIAGGLAMNPYYRCYEAADGFLAVACLNLAPAASRSSSCSGSRTRRSTTPDLVPDDRAVLAEKQRVTTAIEREIATGSVEAWLARLGSAAVPAGPVLARESVHADEQARANGLLQDVEQPGLGSMTMLGGVFRFDGEDPRGDAPRPVARRRHRCGARGGGGVRFTIEPRAGAVRRVGARRARGLGGAARAGLRGVAGRPRRRARGAPRGDRLGRALERSRPPRPRGRRWDRAGTRRAPLCLVDEATLGAPLAIGGRVRHGEGRVEGGEREPTLDGTGTLRGVASARICRPIPPGSAPGAPSRSRTWQVSPTARSSRRSSTRSRASSSARRSPRCRRCRRASPTRPWRATACCSRRGRRPIPEAGFPRDSLAWAGSACREVTVHVQQVHGGIGFALEGGIHRYYRRAKTVQVWTDALLRELG